MGHLIHPVASRLGISTFWNSNSVTLHKQHQSNFALEDVFFQNLFTWFYNFLEKSNFLFTHVIINRLFNKILFCTIIYNATVDSNLYPFYESSYKKIASPEVTNLSLKRFFLHFENLKKSKSQHFSPVFKKKLFSQNFNRRDRLFFQKYKAFKFLRFYRKFFRRPFYSVPLFHSSVLTARGSRKSFLDRSKRASFFLTSKKPKSFFFRQHARKIKNRKLKRSTFFKSLNFLRFSKFFHYLNLDNKSFLKNIYNNHFFRIKLKNKNNEDKKKFKYTLAKKFLKKENNVKDIRKKKNKLKNLNILKKNKDSLITTVFYPFLKKNTEFMKFFSSFFVSSPDFLNILTRNTYSFFKNIYFWYFFNFKNSLFGFFINNLLLVNSKLNFIFFFLTSGSFNAALLCKYITTRLHQGVQLFDIIRPLIFKIIAFERTSGFKISCAGRFSRKQIAAYSWQLRGELPLNSFGRVVDYYSSSAFLNNSVCGLKVWLCFPEKSLFVKRRGFFFSGRSFCL